MMLETIAQIPLFHRNELPTLREVLDSIPYIPKYIKVYLFIVPCKYTIGNKYISSLKYVIQVGNWVRDPDNDKWLSGRKFVPEVKLRYQAFTNANSNELTDEIRRIYDKVIPVKISSDNNVDLISKPPISEINNSAYVFRDDREVLVIGKYHSSTGNIITPDHIYAEFVTEIPTLHSYGYYGLFKPSLQEAIKYIPNNVISTNDDDKYLITTRSPDVDINRVCIGNYHVGITTIWRIIKPDKSAPPVDKSAPPVVDPVDDYK